jgi:hypothetical protein
MCSMLMSYLHTKFQKHSTTGSLGITIKTTNKGSFKAILLLYTIQKYFFNIIEYFSKVYYHKSFQDPTVSVGGVTFATYIYVSV